MIIELSRHPQRWPEPMQKFHASIGYPTTLSKLNDAFKHHEVEAEAFFVCKNSSVVTTLNIELSQAAYTYLWLKYA